VSFVQAEIGVTSISCEELESIDVGVCVPMDVLEKCGSNPAALLIRCDDQATDLRGCITTRNADGSDDPSDRRRRHIADRRFKFDSEIVERLHQGGQMCVVVELRLADIRGTLEGEDLADVGSGP
jgi:hypothetical protein